MVEVKIKNSNCTFVLIIFIGLPIFALIILAFFPPITLLEIALGVFIFVASVYSLWTIGHKYSLVLSDKYIQIFSRRYNLSQLKFVSFVPFIKSKNNKIYAYMIFYIQKPKSSKFKKIRTHGGFVDNHYKLLDFLQKHRIRYGKKVVLMNALILTNPFEYQLNLSISDADTDHDGTPISDMRFISLNELNPLIPYGYNETVTINGNQVNITNYLNEKR